MDKGNQVKKVRRVVDSGKTRKRIKIKSTRVAYLKRMVKRLEVA